AKIQESKDVFVHEVKPEEAMILARSAAQRELEEWRIAKCRQDDPWRRDQQNDQGSAEWPKAPPRFARKQLPGGDQINERGASGNLPAQSCPPKIANETAMSQ